MTHTTTPPPDPAGLPWHQPKPKRPIAHSFVIGLKALSLVVAGVLTAALLVTVATGDAAEPVGDAMLILLALLVAGVCHLVDRAYRRAATRHVVPAGRRRYRRH